MNAVEVGGEIIVGMPKSHKRRSVPFPSTLAYALAQACEGKQPNDLVFADRPGVCADPSPTTAGGGTLGCGLAEIAARPVAQPNDVASMTKR